ncbi:MAG: helix-turn-helix domain-containing protein [Ruminococcus sp.]|nr:helix-turn-helix domain-containing protein [Ruminococcus sp.]
MAENNEIMKFEEVMEYLNIGKSTLYNLLRSGKIKSFKIGKVWKIPRSAVEEYVRKSMN